MLIIEDKQIDNNQNQKLVVLPDLENKETLDQIKKREIEMKRQYLIQLKNNTDPNKWKFIEEIKTLAEQQNNFSFSTMEAIVRNSQKNLQDLFYVKYDLSLNQLIVTDLLINFRDISRFCFSFIPSA